MGSVGGVSWWGQLVGSVVGFSWLTVSVQLNEHGLHIIYFQYSNNCSLF